MGKQKYLIRVLSLFNKSPVVSFNSIERIIKNKRNIKQYAKQLIRNLIKQKKIIKLSKGIYTKHNEISLSVFCFKPSYLGLQNAMSFHNLWEQETIPIIITSKKARAGIRQIQGANIMIKRINKKYLFGFDYCLDSNFYIPYSDIEKTFIDMIHFKQPLDKEQIRNFREKIKKTKLKTYLKYYPPRFRKLVLRVLSKKQ